MTDIVDVDALEQRKNDLCLDADSYAFDQPDLEVWCNDMLAALRQQPRFARVDFEQHAKMSAEIKRLRAEILEAPCEHWVFDDDFAAIVGRCDREAIGVQCQCAIARWKRKALENEG